MNELGLVRLPGRRPMRKAPQIEKREVSWDSRFYLGRIPTYQAQHDRHAQPYIARKKNIVLGPGKIRKRRDQSPHSIQSSSSKWFRGAPGPLMKTQILKQSLETLLRIWNEKGIDNQFRKAF